MQRDVIHLSEGRSEPITGRHAAAEGHRVAIDTAVVTEDAGVDSIRIGEHHRTDYAFSFPPVLLAAEKSRGSVWVSTRVTPAVIHFNGLTANHARR